MKQLLLLLALLSPSFAQLPAIDYAGMFFSTTQGTSSVPIRKVSSLPGTCTAVGAASSSNAVLYQGRVYMCTTTDNWTPVVTTTTGANLALSNLSSVSINASLIPQTTLNLGAQATPWKDLWLYGSGTFGSHSFRLTGTPAGHRVITFPDATITVAGSASALTSGRVPYITSGGLLTETDTLLTNSTGQLAVGVNSHFANTMLAVGSGNSGTVDYRGYYNNGTYNLYQRYGGWDFAGASGSNLYVGGITGSQWADLNLMASGATKATATSAGFKIASSSALLFSNLAFSATAPTVTSAGTSPSITASNGTAAFEVNVGTGGTATTIVLAMPTATTGWNCHATNITATAANRADQAVRQTASTTTSVTLQNQTVSTGAALAFTASDVVRCQCTAY